MSDEQYQQDVMREMNMADFEEKEAEQEAIVDTPIEMEMWQSIPKAEKDFPEINKDWLTANLETSEMFAISMNNELHNSIVAMKASLKAQWKDFTESDKEMMAVFFLPGDLTQAPKRRIYSILALSNSKDGFWRKLSRTRLIQKGFQYDEKEKEETRNLNLIPFGLFRKKKNKKY